MESRALPNKTVFQLIQISLRILLTVLRCSQEQEPFLFSCCHQGSENRRIRSWFRPSVLGLPSFLCMFSLRRKRCCWGISECLWTTLSLCEITDTSPLSSMVDYMHAFPKQLLSACCVLRHCARRPLHSDSWKSQGEMKHQRNMQAPIRRPPREPVTGPALNRK